MEVSFFSCSLETSNYKILGRSCVIYFGKYDLTLNDYLVSPKYVRHKIKTICCGLGGGGGGEYASKPQKVGTM